jgi:hypothetical protein
MTHAARFRLALFLVVSVLCCTPLLAQVGGQDPHAEFLATKLKIDGAASCNNAKCHGAPEPAAEPKPLANEYTTWSAKDPHARAFESLLKPNVKKNPAFGEIAKKLNIANAATDARCTTCHTFTAPAEMQGQKFNLKEGVTCASCHGPSEKWLEPHAAEGWTNKQRAAQPNHAALFKAHGLYDTKQPVARADRCVSCHLAIDPALVAAGHPQPVFELDFYSTLANFSTEDFEKANHWRDPKGFYPTHIWAAGQAVALRDAMKQLADRCDKGAPADAIKSAHGQAMGHYKMFRQLLATKAVAIDPALLDAQAAKLDAAVKANPKEAATIARALAKEAAKSLPGVTSLKPDAAITKSLLTTVLAEPDLGKTYGHHAAEQQAFAIYALYQSQSKNAGVTAEQAAPNLELIGKLFDVMGKPGADMAQYQKDLDAVRGKLK